MKNSLLVDLLEYKPVQRLFNIFDTEIKNISLVGGCVRDKVLGKKTKDIDVAANISPKKIIEILNNNKIIFNDFAYKYGSITATIENQKFQITSLREDINQKGRHSEIKYTEDWKIDAQRRDFTINALYLFSDGKILDYFDGQKDLQECRLKFIGNIEDRVQQDFLRIFRYYRFLGLYEKPKLINSYDEVLKRNCIESFKYISNDKIRQEILKMFNMTFPVNCFYEDINNKKIFFWVQSTSTHFKHSQYSLGLKKCLNKVDLLIS